ncbi:MAG: gliding motility-associated C-terminal domain-containing protein, partial [Bacteroidales bacterium]|nr:gliding motility-associated C-terminal domain-containing protein [Bacteroidales bacterium]
LAVAVTVDNPPAPTGASPQYFCQINNPTVASLTATGTGIKWYLNASDGSSLSTSTVITTRTYYASQTYGSCESTTRFAVSVVVNNPSAPTGTSPQSFCAIDNPTVASIVASGSDLRWYNVISGGLALPSTTPLNNATYYASQTLGGCESSSRLAVVVTVGNPAAPAAPSPQIFCAANNPTVGSLTATGTSIRWYLTSTGGAPLASSTPLVTGTYYASQTVGTCESASRRSVAVTVNNPSAPTGPASQDFCLITNPTVANLAAAGTGIRWYSSATGGTALAPATPLATGTYYATQTISGCESVLRLMVSVTVSIPLAPTGDAVQVFCSGSNPTVANLTAVGLNIRWYLTPVGGTPLSSTTALVTGNYYASQMIGVCESAARLAVAVTVNQTPVANAGTGGDACGLSFNLNAITPLAGTGTWSQTSGPGTAVFAPGPGTPNAVVTVTAYGTYTFTWTVINNNCVNSATITVNFYQQPLSNPGTGGVECDLNFALNAVPGTGLGTWSLVTGTGTASFIPTPNAPDATVIVSEYGTYTFRWTEANGTCTSNGVVTVNFYEQPVADAGPGGDACDFDYQLAAVPSTGIGSWSMIGGTGGALFTPDASSPSALVTVSEYGTKQFRWIETNGICADTAVITVNFNQQPVANAGTGGNNCGLEFNLSAVPSFGVGTWTIESGPGTASYTPNANSPTAEIRVSDYGTYVLRWTEMNGSCSSSATVSVTFIAQPSADAGNGGNECDLTFLLNAVPAPSGNGLWSKISGPGEVTFTPDATRHNATVSVNQFGSYDFAWTLNNSQCTSSDIIRVTFHDLPQVNAGADAAVCEDRAVQLNATGTGTFAWVPAASLSNPSVSNPLASPDETTTYTVTLTDQYGCINSDQIKVEVRSQPVADAGEDQDLDFLFEADLDANEPGQNETGAWTILMGEGDFSDLNDPQARVSELGIEVNSFIWTVTNGVCPVSSDTVNITVRSLIIPTLITPNLDGNNDFFVIKGIESLGETSLTIFNRWGARVFENKNYDNLWNGVDDKENPLPEDTYFYILKPEKSKTLKGYVVIRR